MVDFRNKTKQGGAVQTQAFAFQSQYGIKSNVAQVDFVAQSVDEFNLLFPGGHIPQYFGEIDAALAVATVEVKGQTIATVKGHLVTFFYQHVACAGFVVNIEFGFEGGDEQTRSEGHFYKIGVGRTALTKILCFAYTQSPIGHQGKSALAGLLAARG